MENKDSVSANIKQLRWNFPLILIPWQPSTASWCLESHLASCFLSHSLTVGTVVYFHAPERR